MKMRRLCLLTLSRFHPQLHFTLVAVPRRDEHEVLVALFVSLIRLADNNETMLL
jgi:hypothetical protein